MRRSLQKRLTRLELTLLPRAIAERNGNVPFYREEAEALRWALQELEEDGPRIGRALALIVAHGGTDGEHHKTWVIDQVARILAGDGYADLVARARAGRDGPKTYAWDVGIAP